jgi:hypothetical protein
VGTLQDHWEKLVAQMVDPQKMSGEDLEKLKRVWLDGAQAMLFELSERVPPSGGIVDIKRVRAAIHALNDEVMGAIARIHKATN